VRATAVEANGQDGTAAELLAAISAVRRTARRAVRQRWHAEPSPTAQSELLRLVAAQPGISVAEAAGETFGLLGPNGPGKTTTIRMLTTLLKPAEGSATVFGINTARKPMRVRRMIGYVPQLLSADASLTGRENVELFARLFDVPRRQRRERIAEVLGAMGLDEAAGRLVKTYSGGMVRRLELAQALVNAPRLLVLDEPTVGLDPVARADVWDFITGLREVNAMTVLMTTHHMDEADLYCDRIALMHRGTHLQGSVHQVSTTGSDPNLIATLPRRTGRPTTFSSSCTRSMAPTPTSPSSPTARSR